MRFKNGEILTCIQDDDSGYKLNNNKKYIAEGNSFIFQHVEYVKIKNVKANMFYVDRFVNEQEIRKQKLDKLNQTR